MYDLPEVIISSAVLLIEKGCKADVSERLVQWEGVEIWGSDEHRIVITIEANTRGEAGALLSEFSLLQGVLSANMVFECADPGDGVQT